MTCNHCGDCEKCCQQDPCKGRLKEKVANSSRELAIDIGAEIKLARIKAGFTQTKLAKLMGTKQPSIARAERGKVMPSLGLLLRIAKACNKGIVSPKISPKQ